MRAVLIAVPASITAALFAASVDAGVAAAVLSAGAGAATATYAKNRTDRHNAAVERGEIRVPPDPHLIPVPPSAVDNVVRDRLHRIGYPTAGLARVQRFDGGWLVERRQRAELGVVLGDDGGLAYYDPRWVPDIRAATEYIAGRGRESRDSEGRPSA